MKFNKDKENEDIIFYLAIKGGTLSGKGSPSDPWLAVVPASDTLSTSSGQPNGDGSGGATPTSGVGFRAQGFLNLRAEILNIVPLAVSSTSSGLGDWVLVSQRTPGVNEQCVWDFECTYDCETAKWGSVTYSTKVCEENPQGLNAWNPTAEKFVYKFRKSSQICSPAGCEDPSAEIYPAIPEIDPGCPIRGICRINGVEIFNSTEAGGLSSEINTGDSISFSAEGGDGTQVFSFSLYVIPYSCIYTYPAEYDCVQKQWMIGTPEETFEVEPPDAEGPFAWEISGLTATYRLVAGEITLSGCPSHTAPEPPTEEPYCSSSSSSSSGCKNPPPCEAPKVINNNCECVCENQPPCTSPNAINNNCECDAWACVTGVQTSSSSVWSYRRDGGTADLPRSCGGCVSLSEYDPALHGEIRSTHESKRDCDCDCVAKIAGCGGECGDGDCMCFDCFDGKCDFVLVGCPPEDDPCIANGDCCSYIGLYDIIEDCKSSLCENCPPGYRKIQSFWNPTATNKENPLP